MIHFQCGLHSISILDAFFSSSILKPCSHQKRVNFAFPIHVSLTAQTTIVFSRGETRCLPCVNSNVSPPTSHGRDNRRCGSILVESWGDIRDPNAVVSGRTTQRSSRVVFRSFVIPSGLQDVTLS